MPELAIENQTQNPARTRGTSCVLDQLDAARRVSTPLIQLATPDPQAFVRALTARLARRTPPDPLVVWDACRGLTGLNEPGQTAATDLIGGDGQFDPTRNNPAEALLRAPRLPRRSVLCLHHTQRWIDDLSCLQAIANLRDLFASTGRTLLLLGPGGPLPPEIAGDVISLDEPLPDGARLREIVTGLRDAAGALADDSALDRAVEAVQGLPAFAAEQVTAMALASGSLDLAALWERKRQQIEQTPGLSVYRGQETFQQIGGVEVVKSYLHSLLAGPARPGAVVFLDEIEKALAGATSDTSGVSRDQLGALLSYMEDEQAAGLIFIGPPGAAKSAVAKATGNEAGIPTIRLDLGGAKGSLVGQSEANLRTALKVITAVSNRRSLWIATCNSITDLPPELRRRFTLGTFFFDLPDEEERSAIWNIWLERYGMQTVRTARKSRSASRSASRSDGSIVQQRIDDSGWTGAEIRQCCDVAWRLQVPLQEAARYVVPVSRSAAASIDRLRKQADGRFLSASQPGVFRCDTGLTGDPLAESPSVRQFNTDE